MTTFEPLINLIVLLTALSVAAERVTNVLKLRHPDLRNERGTRAEEKDRERGITIRSVAVGMLLAIAMKADLFEILAELDAPWETLGWVQVSAGQWTRAAATVGVGPFLYALIGSAFTGIALGFGSKFWHDILDIVFQLRKITEVVREKRLAETTAIANGALRDPEAPHA